MFGHELTPPLWAVPDRVPVSRTGPIPYHGDHDAVETKPLSSNPLRRSCGVAAPGSQGSVDRRKHVVRRNWRNRGCPGNTVPQALHAQPCRHTARPRSPNQPGG
jgi:hypothetical protein